MDNIENTLTFDFTPDPKVLIALSHTSMSPVDALCELIDNSIDSFEIAKIQGVAITKPLISIQLPSKQDLDNGIGVFRIMDNGPGMSPDDAEKAIRAGYSGNNNYDSLGLFGMGFNISTSKIGIVTNFITARKDDPLFTRVIIDLDKINKEKSYILIAERIKKSEISIDHGTVIEISNWWPDGNANHNFLRKLIANLSGLRAVIGRRYASILRDNYIRIAVNGKPCEPYEHCAWGANRFVVRNGINIPAKYDFDKILGTHRGCSSCRAVVPEGATKCPACGSTSIRTVSERISGWVGIQRFDDPSKFGIDLIRNGRTIRIEEKSAFFDYTDELNNVTKEYPVDGIYGRIIGEVHMDFVPVDFLKQDFQRNSQEWQKAIKFLRGETSLLPRKVGDAENNSPIFMLFQGYRKVRTPGTVDMYMGYWDKIENKPKRITRDTEREYYEKFLNKEPGYFDDAEWWKLVEEASKPPLEPMPLCPNCHSQNPDDADVCSVCGEILHGKECINCRKTIPRSAVVCQFCGQSQVPKYSTPWVCYVCNTSNKADAIICSNCGNPKGTPDPLSPDYLVANSNKDDSLSIESASITLADGKESSPIKVETFFTEKPLIKYSSKERIPLVVRKESGLIQLFIDPDHPLFSASTVNMEEVVSTEIASFLFDIYRPLAKHLDHSISNIAWQIENKYWIDSIKLSKDSIEAKCNSLFNEIKSHLSSTINEDTSQSLYEELSSNQENYVITGLKQDGKPLSLIGEYIKTGEIIRYIPNDFILSLFSEKPECFFNGNVWDVDYNVTNAFIKNPEVLKQTYEQTFQNYHNCIECITLFLQNTSMVDIISLKRIEAVVQFLSQKMVINT